MAQRRLSSALTNGSITEKIDGSPGNDILTDDNGNNGLLGRGGDDKLMARLVRSIRERLPRY